MPETPLRGVARGVARIGIASGRALILASSIGLPAPAETIMQIQGTAHRSPLVGRSVGGVAGIVTARTRSGFYLQDAVGDGDPATSDALYVYTRSTPPVDPGDRVVVAGTVFEYRPGCSSSTTLDDETCTARSAAFHNLTVTELVAPSITTVSSGEALPPVTWIGGGEAVPPGAIGDSIGGSVEAPGYRFDRAQHALDFFETLEGMRVAVAAPVVVGPTDAFGVVPILADGGSGQGALTARGGIAVTAASRNGGRILLDDALAATPEANTGDRLEGVEGVVDYRYGGYRLHATRAATRIAGYLPRQTARDPSPDALSIAAFNVENLAATSPAAKLGGIAQQIAVHLGGPAIVALAEMQDDSGPTDDGTTTAAATFAALAAAIEAAGGPPYAFVQVDPEDGADGGAPGANIRVGFLFDPRRVSLGDAAPVVGDATTPIRIGAGGRFDLDAGRVDPQNAVWSGSRKPLAARFRFRGHTVGVIAMHLRSKSGDGPLFGRFQPPIEPSQARREAQAEGLGGFVEEILAADPGAAIALLGDANDFDFSPALERFARAGLVDLSALLPESERYTFVFDGNAQALDHALVSPSLAAGARYEIVHVNSEYRAAERASDHDPVLAELALPASEPGSAARALAAAAAFGGIARRRLVANGRRGADQPAGAKHTTLIATAGRRRSRLR